MVYEPWFFDVSDYPSTRYLGISFVSDCRNGTIAENFLRVEVELQKNFEIGYDEKGSGTFFMKI